jgi:hypothetical protein
MSAIYFQTKLVFIRYSRAPSMLSHNLIRILPFSLLLHVIMGMQFIGAEEVIPQLINESFTQLIQWSLFACLIFYVIFKKDVNRLLLRLIRAITECMSRGHPPRVIAF